VADRARLAHTTKKVSRHRTDMALFTAELLDVSTAALQASVSEETTALLHAERPTVS
jgi:hypothetical protein